MAESHAPESKLSDTQEQYDAELKKILRETRPDCAPRSRTHKEREDDITVRRDITGKSKCTGTLENFSEYFHSRYETIREIFEERGLHPRPVDALTGRKGGEDVVVIGMVTQVWTTQAGNRLVELEDTTGLTRAVFTDEQPQEKSQEVVPDEVIAIEGQLSDDGDIIFGDDLHFPDVPPRNRTNTTDRDVKAALISDPHFGSTEFAYDRWDGFVDWVREEEDLEYILVAGDMVEGIGVYPGQRDELFVDDIYLQYKLCAEAFKELPDDVTIICSVGNHDSVRLEEPQPTIRDEFQEYFADNVKFIGNPAYVDLEGVSFLLYHGMSINPLLGYLPEGDIQDPESAMVPLLRKRHLAPMYGDVRIAPEEEDYLVIDEVPDVFHAGHVHTFGRERYNNVEVVNTGTWQKQTDFQKAKNVEPDVGYAPVINLGNFEMEILKF